MIESLLKAIGQLTDPRFRRVLILSLAITFLLYVLFYGLIGWGLTQLSLFDAAWINWIINALGGVAVFLVSLLIFPSIAIVVMGLLLDDVVSAVEEKYYPGQGDIRKQSVGETVWGSVRFAMVAVLINLIALPAYLALMIIGVGIVLFYVINAYLLSREYFEMVALRRLTQKETDAVRRANRFYLWRFGFLLTFISTLPFINVIAPLVATAAMVHVFEKIRPKGQAGLSGK